ncbi:MAG: hypothetical protein KDD99_22910 [Bacteroidetes bacterium]|nr:hypothetical protein [Bacteroidota bacterium]
MKIPRCVRDAHNIVGTGLIRHFGETTLSPFWGHPERSEGSSKGTESEVFRAILIHF